MARLARAPGEGRVRGLLDSPLGALVTRPWFDRFALWGLLRWYFPLSRLWAAAGAAEGDPGHFAQATGRRVAPGLLIGLQQAQASAVAAEARWQAAAFAVPNTAAFAARDTPAGDLAAIERDRRAASHRFMAWRARFAPYLRSPVPGIRWEIPEPDAMLGHFGGRMPRPEDLYAAPAGVPDMQQSNGFTTGDMRVSWLRFTSPYLGDPVTARILEPIGAPRATVVVCHGLMVEGEQWRGSVGTAEALAEIGLRAVELTAPWHGRRALPGWYGGEPFLGMVPLGPLRLFAAQVKECAAAIAWCRARWEGPVGLAGISLGSFAAQLVASHAGSWPPSHRPDGVLLITHHGRLAGVLGHSALAHGIDLLGALGRAGWTEAGLAPWAALADPLRRPTVPGDRIVSLLARRDVVTPYPGGADLALAWNLPAVNRVVVERGHFTASLLVSRKHLAIRRLGAILCPTSTL